MKIEMIPIERVQPYRNNAKIHTKKQIEQIKRSIIQFDNCDPIAVWGKDNIIVEGHGRYLALKQLNEKVIPCIRLDHLTDEQRKAYTLIHNKLTMDTDFDLGLLEEELESITEIDMDEFEFELPDGFVAEMEHEEEKENTQQRVENILNLGRASFAGVGMYDIPQLDPISSDEIGKIKEWIGFNYVLSDNDPEGKAVHFFIDDYQFERVWNNPDKYVEKLKEYACVLTPDFSPYSDMPMATQIFNHYRKHWIGRYLQENGVKVVPTIRASQDERSLSWYLDGEPKGGVVCISAMWTKDERERNIFLKEFRKMKEVLKPEKIYVYGGELDDLGEVERIQTFARKRFGDG